MKPFQSRVVAAWIVALPLSYAINVDRYHRIARLSANPAGEAAIQIQKAQRLSFVGIFIGLFIFVGVLSVVVEALANLIRRWFPEPPASAKTGV
jgi:hypothetical protein